MEITKNGRSPGTALRGMIFMAMGQYCAAATVGFADPDEAQNFLRVQLNGYFPKLEPKVDMYGNVAFASLRVAGDQMTFFVYDESSFLEDDGRDDPTGSVHRGQTFAIPGLKETFVADAGFGLIMAPTGWGKSTFVYRGLIPRMKTVLSDAESSTVISFGEPREYVDTTVVEYVSRAQTLLLEIALFLNADSERVMFIDSLRPFVYDKSVGGTGARGLDQYLPVQITALSNVIADCGKLVVATLNPMINLKSEPDRYDELADMMIASSPMVIVGRSFREAELHLRGPLQLGRDPQNLLIPELSITSQKGPSALNVPSTPVIEIAPTHNLNIPGAQAARILARSQEAK